MDVRTLRRRTLSNWLRYRQSPPTMGTLARTLLPRVALPLAVLALCAAVVVAVGDAFWRGLAIGAFVATVAPLPLRLHLAARAWPVVADFLDWPKVDQAARDEGLS